MTAEVAAGLTGLLEPIPGSNPCGVTLDVDAEDDLLWLQDQIEKTTTFGGGDVDWSGILERSTRLFGRSKDWSLACYAARALYQTAGVAALPAGLAFLRDAAARYWDGMYPALPAGRRRRANMVDWLAEGLADDLERRAPEAADAGAIGRAGESLAALDALLAERLQDAYGGVRRLRRALERQAERLAAPAAEAGPAPVEAAAAVPAVPAPVEFPPPITDAATADRVLITCREALLAVADALLAADPAAALAYRVRRQAAWMYVDREPPATDGRLGLAGPAAEDGARLRAALGPDPRGVLDEAEGRLQAFPLWLDLQQIADAALARLGPEHAPAREAIRQETRALLRRAPGLPDLRFADDVPLADDDTREWLQAEVAAEPEAAPAAAPGPAAGDGRLAETAAEAAALARAGRLEDSLALFGRGLETAGSGRERFRWRLAAARHCAQAGQTDLALDLLEGLDREAARLDLEAWEPDLCQEVLQAALQVGRKGKGRKGPPQPLVLERLPDLPKRLARLDLVGALRITRER
jgi:type VI secretion system protein VasJ